MCHQTALTHRESKHDKQKNDNAVPTIALAPSLKGGHDPTHQNDKQDQPEIQKITVQPQNSRDTTGLFHARSHDPNRNKSIVE
jgi:hypothetical protein